MRPIQLILIPILVIVLLFFTPKLKRSVLLQGLFVVAILGLMLFVVVPDWSTIVANYLGIGRGVDLITYLGLLSLGVLGLLLFIRMRKLEEKLVELVREQAIKEEKSGADADN